MDWGGIVTAASGAVVAAGVAGTGVARWLRQRREQHAYERASDRLRSRHWREFDNLLAEERRRRRP